MQAERNTAWHLKMGQLASALASSSMLTPCAFAADGAPIGTFAAVGLVALAVAGVLFSAATLQRARSREMRLVAELADARRNAAERTALLLSGDAPLYLYVNGQQMRPRVFGPDPERLERLLRGPDSGVIADAIRKLCANGDAFTLTAQEPSGTPCRMRGRAAGRDAAVTVERISEGEMKKAPMPSVNSEFSGLVDALPMPFAVRGRDGRLIYANAAYARAAGASSPASAMAAQAKLFSDESALAESALGTGKAVKEQRFAVMGGQRRSIEAHVSPLGDVVGIAISDESGAADARSKLQRHIDAYNETLNRLKTAVAVFGPDQKLTFFNTAYVDLWRLDSAWLAQKPSEGDILDALRDKRRLPEEKSFKDFKRARAELYGKVTAPQEEFWHLPDGTTLRIAGQPHPFGGLLYLYEDMTEQLNLERRYNDLFSVQRSTLDHLSEGVAFFGTDGRLKLWNASFADLWMLGSEQLSGEPHVDKVALLCAGLGSTTEWDTVRVHVIGGSQREDTQGEMRRADGLTLRYAAVSMPDGATLTSFVDMTDSVRAEQSLMEKNEALTTAARLKTEFISHVSYQLIVPLTSIMGFSEALQAGIAGPLNPRQDDYLRNVVAASAELKTQIDNMVDLAAIDAGELSLDLRPFDPVELLSSLRAMVQDRCNKQGLELVVAVPESIGLMTGDSTRLKQVMFNLLANAMTFTPSGETIEFGAAAEGEGVRFWVRDTGPGLAPEQQARAFERFQSSKGGEGPRGPGLGLALANSIIALHGGWVSLQSEKGKGATFTCHLPRAIESPALPGFDAPVRELPEPEAGPGTVTVSDAVPAAE